MGVARGKWIVWGFFGAELMAELRCFERTIFYLELWNQKMKAQQLESKNSQMLCALMHD
jgi:hypothetical protein